MRSSLVFSMLGPLFAASAACGPAGQPKDQGARFTPAPATPERPTPSLVPEGVTPTVAEHMKDHFTQAIRARDAIIRGDLAAMKEPATWLAEHKIAETLPGTWTPHVGDMQNAARLALQANDLAAAADAVAAMGAACGSCHKALGASVDFSGKSPEGEESSVLAQMLRHRWAAERMWEGLIGPSDVAWNAGVAALQEAPLHPEMLADKKSPPQKVMDLATRVHAVGQQGKTASGSDARAKLYGEYVANCDACHAELGVRLKPSS